MGKTWNGTQRQTHSDKQRSRRQDHVEAGNSEHMGETGLPQGFDGLAADRPLLAGHQGRGDGGGIAAQGGANTLADRCAQPRETFRDRLKPRDRPKPPPRRQRLAQEVADGSDAVEIAVEAEIVEAGQSRSGRRRQPCPARQPLPDGDRPVSLARQQRHPLRRPLQLGIGRAADSDGVAPVTLVRRLACLDRAGKHRRHRRIDEHRVQPRRLPMCQHHAGEKKKTMQENQPPRCCGMAKPPCCHAENAKQQCNFEGLRRIYGGKPCQRPKPKRYRNEEKTMPVSPLLLDRALDGEPQRRGQQ